MRAIGGDRNCRQFFAWPPTTAAMRRRRLLGTLGTVGLGGLAGCSGGNQAVDERSGTRSTAAPTDTVSTAATSKATAPTSTGAAGTTTTAPGTASPGPELTTREPELTRVDLGDYSGPAAEVDLMNTGEVAARAVTLRLDWLDGDDGRIAPGTEFVPTLAPGETFRVRATPSRVRLVESVDTVEASVEGGEAATGLDPEGVTLVDRRLRNTDQFVRLRGTVRNERGTALEHVTAAGKFYDAGGVALAITATSETDLPPGDSWGFQLLPDTVGRNGAVAAAVVLSAEQLVL